MRDYDPTTGRYIQADPLGLVDGPSFYGYASQSPFMFTDFRGLKDKRNTYREGRLNNLSGSSLTIYDTDNRTKRSQGPMSQSPPGTDWDFFSDGCSCYKIFTYATVTDGYAVAFHSLSENSPMALTIPDPLMRMSRWSNQCPVTYKNLDH